VVKLPVVSGRDVVRALEKVGYVLDRQKASHMLMRESASPFRRITVPDHKEISRGTLRAITRHAGLTVEEFHSLLES
jgi:predicted RNA binding protein YcfA (HicA-like mRNA interferase family)